MRVYIDTSALNRPFDDQRQARIYLEASAIVGVLAWIAAGKLELLSSEVLEFELSRNPFDVRRAFVRSVLSRASQFQRVDDEVLRQARRFEQSGAKPIDALHLAAASRLRADAFLTCDDRLLKGTWEGLRCVNPAVFVIEARDDRSK